MEKEFSSEGFESVTTLLDNTFTTYKKHFRALILAVLPTAFISLLPAIVSTLTRATALHVSFFSQRINLTISILLVLAGFTFLWGIIATITQLFYPTNSYRQTASIVIKRALPFLWTLILAAIIFLGITAVFALLMLFTGKQWVFALVFIPAILLLVRMIFVPYLIMHAQAHGFRAFRLSRTYTQGHWWDIFEHTLVILVILSLLGFVANALIGNPEYMTTGNLTVIWLKFIFLSVVNIAALSFVTTYIFTLFMKIEEAPKTISKAQVYIFLFFVGIMGIMGAFTGFLVLKMKVHEWIQWISGG